MTAIEIGGYTFRAAFSQCGAKGAQCADGQTGIFRVGECDRTRYAEIFDIPVAEEAAQQFFSFVWRERRRFISCGIFFSATVRAVPEKGADPDAEAPGVHGGDQDNGDLGQVEECESGGTGAGQPIGIVHGK